MCHESWPNIARKTTLCCSQETPFTLQVAWDIIVLLIHERREVCKPVFVFQKFDVNKVKIIHKPIQPNLKINKKTKGKNLTSFFILATYLNVQKSGNFLSNFFFPTFDDLKKRKYLEQTNSKIYNSMKLHTQKKVWVISNFIIGGHEHMMLQYAFLDHCDHNFCCFSMIGFLHYFCTRCYFIVDLQAKWETRGGGGS